VPRISMRLANARYSACAVDAPAAGSDHAFRYWSPELLAVASPANAAVVTDPRRATKSSRPTLTC